MSTATEVKLRDNWFAEALDDAEVDVAMMNPHHHVVELGLKPGWLPKRLRARLREKMKARFKWHTGEEL